MSIGEDTPRARGIAAKRGEISELLRADQFRSNRAIAGAVECGHPLVAKARAELTDDEGMIVGAPRWRRDAPALGVPRMNDGPRVRIGADDRGSPGTSRSCEA